jgi:hypothetical protein
VSYGWALLLTLVPWFHEPPLMAGGRAGLLSLAAGWVAVFLQVFTRNFLMDMLDAFGDRVFERETPASVLGPRRAPRLLGALLGLWALFLAMAYLAGALNGAALCLILSGPAYNAMVLRRLVTRLGLGGFRFDLLVDGQFLLSGLLVFAFSRLSG